MFRECRLLCIHQKIYETCGNVNCEHAKRWEKQEILRRLIEEDICFLYIPMEKLAKVAAV